MPEKYKKQLSELSSAMERVRLEIEAAKATGQDSDAIMEPLREKLRSLSISYAELRSLRP